MWKQKLEQVKQYTDENKKRPSHADKNKEIKQLGTWISTQQNNYQKKAHIMSDKTIYDEWTKFISDPKYIEYFTSNEDQWKLKLDKVKQYIDENKKRPSHADKNKEINQLCSWIGTQQKNYHKKKEIMSNDAICDEWKRFISDPKYKEYFKTTQYKTIKPQKCIHKWKVINDDDYYNYKKCEICDMRSKELRTAKVQGYNEPNPDKKLEINEWFVDQKYIKGKAITLDAIGLKTSNHLLKSGSFKPKDIIIPEYDTETFELNSKDEILGECLRNGDYLEILKEINPKEISLIYADFTVSYEKFVEPLLEYISSVKKILRDGTIIGITWSNNGAGDNKKRGRILRDIGKYQIVIGMDEMKESPTDHGYGEGGCMNVIFYRKNK